MFISGPPQHTIVNQIPPNPGSVTCDQCCTSAAAKKHLLCPTIFTQPLQTQNIPTSVLLGAFTLNFTGTILSNTQEYIYKRLQHKLIKLVHRQY